MNVCPSIAGRVPILVYDGLLRHLGLCVSELTAVLNDLIDFYDAPCPNVFVVVRDLSEMSFGRFFNGGVAVERVRGLLFVVDV